MSENFKTIGLIRHGKTLFCRTSLKSGTATAVPAVPAAPPMRVTVHCTGLPAPYNSALVERDRLAETVGPRGVASPAVFIAHQLAQYAERDRHLLFYSVCLSVRRSVRLSVYNASIVPKE